MRKFKYIIISLIIITLASSCKKDVVDLSSSLIGNWQQRHVSIDGKDSTLTAGELNTSLVIEANGVYRLYDGVRNVQHQGTWLFSDGDWLNMSMDKLQTSKFGQVLVRFTVLQVNSESMELRIKTFLFERKLTVMFNYMDQDVTTGMTGEELMALDTKNKELHTYVYVFKKINQ